MPTVQPRFDVQVAPATPSSGACQADATLRGPTGSTRSQPMSDSFLHTGEFYSVLCSVFWSVAVILLRRSGDHTGPVALNTFKNVLGAVLIAITLTFYGPGWIPVDVSTIDVLTLLMSGAIGIAVADTLFLYSLNHLGAGRSAIVDCLYSPFVVLAAFLVLGEPMGGALLLSVALMTAAIVVGTYQRGTTEGEYQHAGPGELARGILAGVGSMFLMAVGIVLAKPVLNHTDPVWATWIRLIGALIALAPQILSTRYRVDLIAAFRPGAHWRVLLPASFIGTYVAVILWTMGMAYTNTSVASVLNQLSNVWVLFLAWPFLGERLTPRKLVAIGLGVLGGLLVTL